MVTVNKELVEAWNQLGSTAAALLILLVFILAVGVLLYRAINLATNQQKAQAEQQKQQNTTNEKLANGLHELSEAITGYRVQLVEVKASIDSVKTDQLEIKVDQRMITDQLRVLAPEIAKTLTPEIKKAISPYFAWLLNEIKKPISLTDNS